MAARIRVLLIIFLMIVCSSALPDRSEAVEGWVSGLRVYSALVTADSYVIDTDGAALSGCGMPFRIIIKAELPLSKAMYATALSAFMSGNKIAVNIPDDNACYQQGVLIDVLAVNLF